MLRGQQVPTGPLSHAQGGVGAEGGVLLWRPSEQGRLREPQAKHRLVSLRTRLPPGQERKPRPRSRKDPGHGTHPTCSKPCVVLRAAKRPPRGPWGARKVGAPLGPPRFSARRPQSHSGHKGAGGPEEQRRATCQPLRGPTAQAEDAVPSGRGGWRGGERGLGSLLGRRWLPG